MDKTDKKERNRKHVFTVDLGSRKIEARLTKLSNLYGATCGIRKGRARTAYLLSLINREYALAFPEQTAPVADDYFQRNEEI